jgi:hypothetical protein
MTMRINANKLIAEKAEGRNTAIRFEGEHSLTALPVFWSRPISAITPASLLVRKSREAKRISHIYVDVIQNFQCCNPANNRCK